jgi:hypothetical protein
MPEAILSIPTSALGLLNRVDKAALFVVSRIRSNSTEIFTTLSCFDFVVCNLIKPFSVCHSAGIERISLSPMCSNKLARTKTHDS